MTEVQKLIADVEAARQRVLDATEEVTTEQGGYTPAPDRWSIAEIVEHLVLAERSGTNYIWRAADGVTRGVPVFSGVSPNRGLTIEEVVERTWQPKEIAPEVARPYLGGPIGYWRAALRGRRPTLADLGEVLEPLDLDTVIYPHKLSGPLDARQRLAFLRFHLDRHHGQIEALKREAGYPS